MRARSVALASILIGAILWHRLAAVDRPNIVLIMADDQGYGDFAIHGNPYVETPNIDQLARQSVRFDRFFVNSFCAPTRAALLTGRWPLRTGCHGVTHNREAMRPSEVTIAEILQSAGYQTGCFGKWHNGEQFPYTAPGQGFAEFFGFNNGHWNDYFDAHLLRGSQPTPTRGFISDVLTNEAIRFISSTKDRPFFCYLAFNAPHSPFQVSDDKFAKFKARGLDDNVAAFYGMCENLDENMGRLRRHLTSLGIAENTIVVLLTDNGGTAGVKLFNAGMRGGKTSVHEGGTRVPLFVHWPNANWQPHLVEQIAAHIDVLPTLLDLCGVKQPTDTRFDGTSLRPLLDNNTSAWPERVLFTHNPIDESNKYPGAVRTQRYRLVREIRGPGGGSKAKANDANATVWQLYDMVADPSQEHDIADQHPEIVQRLSGEYDAWYADVSRDGLERLPLPIGYDQHNPVELHAPQAYYDPPLRFASGPGFANDWLMGWTSAGASIWFDVDVVQAGDYEIELAIACPLADAGSKIRVRMGKQSLEVTVPEAQPREVRLPHRDLDGHARYRNRIWHTLQLGTMSIGQGRTRFIIEALSMPGGQVLELKHAKFLKL